MNEDLFAFHINYDQVYDPENLYPGIVEGLYNGNISETYWLSSTDNTLRKYGYRYDKLNRLKDAYFQQPYSLNYNCQSYNEHLSYDKNGNILTLNRYSRLENFPIAVEIDDLEYFYQGNQLTKVTDLSGYPQGFKDDSDGSNDINDDYAYDAFGNIVHDENKNIELIRYNHLNLPVEILFENGSTIHYLYNAAGQKLRKIVTDLGETGGLSTTEYLDGFQYNSFILQFFSHPEGYVLNTPDRNGDPSFDYVYQYKDHLGNIRMDFLLYYPEGSFVIPHLRVLEENHYYPFGLKHENYNTERRKMAWDVKLEGGEEIDFKKLQQVPNSGYQYKYNGKEWQDELSLNLYDYHARNYDPAIGRWMNIDPLAEMSLNLTPYRYSGNNPVIFKDPNGLWEFQYNSETKTLSLNKSNDEDNFDTFLKESGLTEKQVVKLLFGGGKNGTKAMTDFFDGESSSIDVSKFSGKLGNMLQGMESALSDGNLALSQNPSDAPEDAINNCFNCTLNLTSSGSVDSNPLAPHGSSNSLVSVDGLFDSNLLDRYSNTSSPRLGDAIRYSNDGGINATHGSVFLLQNENGIQIFTKNGYHNSQPYQIMMQSQIIDTYGPATGIQGAERTTTNDRGETRTRTINHSSPFYRR